MYIYIYISIYSQQGKSCKPHARKTTQVNFLESFFIRSSSGEYIGYMTNTTKKCDLKKEYNKPLGVKTPKTTNVKLGVKTPNI